jgi:hypothetical protein
MSNLHSDHAPALDGGIECDPWRMGVPDRGDEP